MVAGEVSGVVAGLATAADAKALYDEASREGRLDPFIAAFRRKLNLLLIGSTGVGKSNLKLAMNKDFPEALSVFDRTPDVQSSRKRFGRYPFVFRDTPGEFVEKAEERKKAYRLHEKAKRRAVVSITSYGYHEYIGALDTAVERGSIAKGFRRDHREREIEMMREWASRLEPTREEFVLTVATKADLWWDSRSKVREYYEQGTYAKELKRLGWTRHHFVEYSAVAKQFYGSVPFSGRFDDASRVALKARLLGVLVELASAERE